MTHEDYSCGVDSRGEKYSNSWDHREEKFNLWLHQDLQLKTVGKHNAAGIFHPTGNRPSVLELKLPFVLFSYTLSVF